MVNVPRHGGGDKNLSDCCRKCIDVDCLNTADLHRFLNLEEKYRAMPVPHTMLINGEASVNKLSRVVSVATPETEDFWAAQVEHLSKVALEVLVKDEKHDTTHVPGHVQDTIHQQSLQLSEEVLQKKGIDINTLLTKFLDQRDAEIASEKEQLAQQCEPRHGRGTTRYIPIRIRNLITKEHGTACSIASCTKPARVIHHTQRFAITRNHDPRFLGPVCAEHHQIAHSIDLKYQERPLRLI